MVIFLLQLCERSSKREHAVICSSRNRGSSLGKRTFFCLEDCNCSMACAEQHIFGAWLIPTQITLAQVTSANLSHQKSTKPSCISMHGRRCCSLQCCPLLGSEKPHCLASAGCLTSGRDEFHPKSMYPRSDRRIQTLLHSVSPQPSTLLSIAPAWAVTAACLCQLHTNKNDQLSGTCFSLNCFQDFFVHKWLSTIYVSIRQTLKVLNTSQKINHCKK